MDPARVRWDNVARLGAVLAVVAVVVLWPRLEAPAPVVPDGAVRDVVPGSMSSRKAVPPAPVAAGPKRPERRPPRVGGKTRLTDAKSRPRPRRRTRPTRLGGKTRLTDEKSGPTPAPADAPPAPGPPPTSTPSPPSSAAIAAAEFGVEP